jgi:hypothetical protein
MEGCSLHFAWGSLTDVSSLFTGTGALWGAVMENWVKREANRQGAS